MTHPSDDEPKFTLDAESLLSKWGFGDGDALSDWWWDNYEEDAPFDDHEVLYELVIAYLAPAIQDSARDVEIVRVETIHNPVRASTLDGVQVDHYSSRAWHIDPPISVQVTRRQIENVAAELGSVADAAGGGR